MRLKHSLLKMELCRLEERLFCCLRFAIVQFVARLGRLVALVLRPVRFSTQRRQRRSSEAFGRIARDSGSLNNGSNTSS